MYLRAVVASEIGNSPLEACKAQAIAARSFALSRMATRGWLYDTSTDQAFISNRDNETAYPNSIKAVKETRGMVLTHGGRLIAAAQYGASNGGATKAYKSYPYFIDRADRWDAAETAYRRERGQTIRVGNRIGLSQYGARWAAKQGIGYRAILDFYYPTAVITGNYGNTGQEGVNAPMNDSKEPAAPPYVYEHRFNDVELAIIAWVKKQVGSGYVWGSTGQMLTPERLDALIRRHGNNIPMPLVTKWLGKKVFDCAGLVTAVFSNMLRTRVISGASSQWKGNYWALKGTIDTMPHDHVVMLYRENPDSNPMRHTGVYIGNGMVVDARGSGAGVILTKFTSYPWTHWALPKGLLSDVELYQLKARLGYVPGTPPTGGESMEKTIGQARVTGNRLALRTTTSTANTPLKRLDTGTIVDIIEKTNDNWWRVKAGPTVGYVMAKYVTQINVTPADPTAPDNGDPGRDEVEDNQFAVYLLCKNKAEADSLMRIFKTAVTGHTYG